jgi:hypothetical protein
MKKSAFIVLALLLRFNLQAQSAAQDVTNGLADLANHDLLLAHQQFADALASSPTNEAANALVAATRLLLLPTQPAGSNFLTAIGYAVAGRDLYNWTSSLPVNASGKTLMPNLNTAVGVAYYRTNIMAALAASRTNLASITDPTFSLPLAAAATDWQSVTVDYGDILMLEALERVAEFAGYTANAQNGDVVLRTLQNMSSTNGLSFQSVLALYPSLLTLADSGDLAASKAALTNAIQDYFAASDFIRNVRAPGANALFLLNADETNDEAVFRTQLTNTLLSLNVPTPFVIGSNALTLDLGSYFTGARTLRSLAPQFSRDNYVPNTLPDYTFGGVLVGEPAWVTEKLLRSLNRPYGGIYLGDNGQLYDYGNPPVSDYNYNTSVSYVNGSFAVFVGTNQQAVLVGTDNGDGTGDATAFGLYAQFTIEKDGSWSFSTASIDGYGSVDRSGDFTGELDYTNGLSVYLYGLKESPLGSFEHAAGYYTGTIKSGPAENFYAVLAADGEIDFCETFSDGEPDPGGWAQFDATNDFSTTNVLGTVLAGTLNTNTLAISGTFSSTHSGTWSLSRSAHSPFDVPPFITSALPSSYNAQAGANVTLSIVVTGSPPLCFQWFSNSTVIPDALTNRLVFDPLSPAAAGTYSVTVSNVVGGTNAVVVLAVGPERVPPTNRITLPTSGERWSNAAFTVTGVATDNVAVASVAYSLNGGAWSLANSTNGFANWWAMVDLTPGTNTIEAYAEDTSDNFSSTNRVSLDFVQTNQLQIRSLGLGTLTPNYSNAWLEIGRNYSITSAPASGFVFTNWTISTNWIGGLAVAGKDLVFMMASNLTLQSVYLETSSPSLTITAPVAGQHVTNALATLLGTSADKWGVAGVWYQLNGGAWRTSVSNNHWTNWSGSLELVSGTNALRAYAVNLGGNFSATNALSVVSSNSFRLQLALTNGAAPSENGQTLNLLISVGLNGVIQYSTNLTTWATLTNFVGTNSSLLFRDPAATNVGRKFYRAVVP